MSAPTTWLPELVDLLARRPELRGVGVADAAEVVTC